MCTLTIVPYKDLLLIGFNRDELRFRKNATPPQIHIFQNVKAIYPIDANHGGTWLGCNEFGFFFFLLNYNQKNLYRNFYKNQAYKDKKSRGFIIQSLIFLDTEKKILDYINNLNYNEYSPFRLIFFNYHTKIIHQFIYTGRGKKFRQYFLPFFQASSGLGDYKIYPLRKKIFCNILHTKQNIKKQILFHEYQNPSLPLSNVKVNRILAKTVSQTFILIKDRKVIFHYRDCKKKLIFKNYLKLVT